MEPNVHLPTDIGLPDLRSKWRLIKQGTPSVAFRVIGIRSDPTGFHIDTDGPASFTLKSWLALRPYLTGA